MPLKIWILSSVLSTKPLIIILSQSFMPKITQNSFIFPQDKPVETQWPSWVAKRLFQKRLLWPSIAFFQPPGTPLFFGMFSVQEKVHSSSWKPRRSRKRESAESLKPHTTENQNPSTWRKAQSKSQTQLCTAVLWVTQRKELQGELSTLWAAMGAWVLSIWLADPLCGIVYGVLSQSLWLIQNSYKCLGNENQKWIFPIPISH